MAIRKMIMGRKVGMTQLFSEDGKAVPVTVLEVGPCYVVQRRTKDNDGYEAIQLGYMEYDANDLRRAEEMYRTHEQRRKTGDRSKIEKEPRGPHRLTMAMYGHFHKRNIPPLRYLKEFNVAAMDDFAEGQEIRADQFAAGDKVNVIGTTKGRGFAGVIKRHHFHGGNATHGSMFHRKAASGGATDAARVFKGSRRPGHMGADQVTIKGLTVIRADADKNLLVIKGAVPGPNGGLVVVTMTERPQIERGKGRFITFTALEKD
ncbi:MAG: 50S ribosomal protein L3 [Armatimonadota bacterium]